MRSGKRDEIWQKRFSILKQLYRKCKTFFAKVIRSSEERCGPFRTRLFRFFLRLYSRAIARSRQGRTIWYRRKHLINSQLAALGLRGSLKSRSPTVLKSKKLTDWELSWGFKSEANWFVESAPGCRRWASISVRSCWLTSNWRFGWKNKFMQRLTICVSLAIFTLSPSINWLYCWKVSARAGFPK